MAKQYKRKIKKRNVYVHGQIKVLRAVALVITAAILTAGTLAALRPTKAPAKLESSRAWLDVRIPEDVPQTKLEYEGFEVSFNPIWHVPNYVAWELTADETRGTVARNSRFAPDRDVYGCATLEDYRRSGFDRGHMVPAADMKWSEQAMQDSHLLTNIVPQDHSLNSGRWNSLEQKCRYLAQRDSAIVIIAGPILSDRIVRTIGNSGVAVPERFFKVIFSPFVEHPQAIAFVMPNRAVQEPLSSMSMTVDRLEEITGFDFFSSLPDSIENAVESEYNPRFWNLY